jgi:predicted lipoprotein
MFKIKIVVLFFVILLAAACNEDEKKNNLLKNFDRSSLLTNYANNLIEPAYNQALKSVIMLEDGLVLLKSEPTVANLNNAQVLWKQLAMHWQHANGFNFGPAAEEGIQKSLLEEIGTFPINKTLTENYIAANDTLFNNFDRNTRGLFAIEYILFCESIDLQQVIEMLKNANRFNYLLACTHQVKTRIEKVQSQWLSYKPNFISNNGTDIGSSTSYFYNEFLKSFEALKNFKFGIPLGKRPGQTSALPNNVEAFYSGYSSELAKEHWKSIQAIWYGNGLNNEQGVGFKDYLEQVEGGSDLIVLTEQQMINVNLAMNNLPNKKLSEAISSDFALVDQVHTELQKMTRFFKSDLSSLIGVAITYSSGDGD